METHDDEQLAFHLYMHIGFFLNVYVSFDIYRSLLEREKVMMTSMTFSLYIQVNRDFSSIFHTLLPNARAKLEPPEGGTVLDGLVMKVNKYFDTHIYLYHV